MTPAAVAVLGAFVGRLSPAPHRDVAGVSRSPGAARRGARRRRSRSRCSSRSRRISGCSTQWNAKINLDRAAARSADRRDVRSSARRAARGVAADSAERWPSVWLDLGFRRRLAGDSAEDRSSAPAIDDGRVEGRGKRAFLREAVARRWSCRMRVVETERFEDASRQPELCATADRRDGPGREG